MEVKSNAKVNLTLDVGDRRYDGFHRIESVFCEIGIADLITIERSPKLGIHLSNNLPFLKNDNTNIVYRAAEAFLQRANIMPELKIHLEKFIPVQGGMGGGSGNAATVLLTLNEMYDHPFSYEALVDMSLALGSDVPYFLTGGVTRVAGIGEKMQALPDITGLHVLVVHPGVGISTAWAYKELDKVRPTTGGAIPRTPILEQAMVEGVNWFGMLSNDFEQAVFPSYPQIQGLKERLLSNGASCALMCGSGSCVFGLFQKREDAEVLEQAVSSVGLKCWLTEPIPRRVV